MPPENLSGRDGPVQQGKVQIAVFALTCFFLQVNVLYDFEAQPGSNELNIHAGEVLTITNRDIGEGWWEGINKRGEKGLFPEAYVEVVSGSAHASPVHVVAPPAVAPPPLPTEYDTTNENYNYSSNNNNSNNGWSNPNAAGYDDWGTSASQGGYDATATTTYTSYGQQPTSQQQQQGQGDEFFGDDWDDSSDEEGHGGKAAAVVAAATSATGGSNTRKPLHSLESNASSSQEGTITRGGTIASSVGAPSAGVRLNLNR